MPKPVYREPSRERGPTYRPHAGKPRTGKHKGSENTKRELQRKGLIHLLKNPDNPSSGVPYGVVIGGATPIWDSEQEAWVNGYGNVICGAMRTGRSMRGPGICCNPAGLGTDHLGTGRCKYHGFAQPTAFSEEAKGNAQIYGMPEDIDPGEAMLLDIRRTAGHVQWLYDRINTAEDESVLHTIGVNGKQASFYLRRYDEERSHLLAATRAAQQLGIAAKQVEIAQEQAKMIAMILQAAFMDERLNLTPEQLIVYPEVIRQHLLAIPATATATATTPEEQA